MTNQTSPRHIHETRSSMMKSLKENYEKKSIATFPNHFPRPMPPTARDTHNTQYYRRNPSTAASNQINNSFCFFLFRTQNLLPASNRAEQSSNQRCFRMRWQLSTGLLALLLLVSVPVNCQDEDFETDVSVPLFSPQSIDLHRSSRRRIKMVIVPSRTFTSARM